MALDDHTAHEKLTPEARRTMLRAFGDRMLIKVTSMDDPEDLPGVERAVRAAAVIERLYSRCDRAEGQAPDPRKLEAERARNAVEAIEQRVVLANTLKWGEARRKDQGHWWDDAKAMAQGQTAKEVMADVAEPVAAEVVRQDEPEETAEVTIASADLTETVPETTASQDAPVAASAGLTENLPETAAAQVAPVAPSVDHDAALRETWARLGLPDITEDELEKFAKLRQKPLPP